MPRIPERFLEAVFFLYRSQADAHSGSNEGGTGFIVSMPSSVEGREFRYLVTNWHVAIQKGFSVPCLIKKDGTLDPLELDCAEWTFTTDLDIAVCPVSGTDEHRVLPIPISSFLERKRKEEEGIGPGDDVFMVGRYTNHQGTDRITPAARFGNISMNPAPIMQSNGQAADSYCIDMQSRSGYSGSPVFVYRTPGYDLGERLGKGSNAKILFSGTNHLSLLGIHWGQFPEIWQVTNGGTLRDSIASNEPLLTEGRFIQGLSGMTCVLPAWSIRTVLNMPKLVKFRERVNAQLLASNS